MVAPIVECLSMHVEPRGVRNTDKRGVPVGFERIRYHRSVRKPWVMNSDDDLIHVEIEPGLEDGVTNSKTDTGPAAKLHSVWCGRR